MTNSDERTREKKEAPDFQVRSPVRTLASAVKDGLRTARYGSAKIARKLDETILNASPPSGIPPELDAGVKSLGRMFLHSVDTLSRVERKLVDRLVPEHRPHSGLGASDLLVHLREEPAAFGVRSSFFARFVRHWVITCLHDHGVVAELLPDSALEQAAERFGKAGTGGSPAEWSAELVHSLMQALPQFHALHEAGAQDNPSALQAYLTLALAITIAQSVDPLDLDEESCWDMARNLVIVEADRLQKDALDPRRLAENLARMARLV